MNILKRTAAVICLICTLFALASCTGETKESNTDADQYHTITFNTHGGSPITSIQAKHNTHVHEPACPTLENHVFYRWEYNNEPWFFDTKKITQDITLDAVWFPAEQFFSIDTHDIGIGIKSINYQKSFERLFVPEKINNLPVVAIFDGGCRNLNDQYAHKIIFPSTLTYVGIEGFKNTKDIHLEFSGALTYLGESAFEDCTALEEITLGNGLEAIPMRAFIGATSLKTIDIPDTVKVIQENAFEDCTSMYTVVLPTSLLTIEDGAFSEAAIKSVFYDGTEEQFDQIEIMDGNDEILNAKLYFYSETKPDAEGNYWHYGNKNTPVIW